MKLRNYQRYAIERILEQSACGLFLDMGLGKTAITLTAIAELMHDRFEIARCLVIAPLRVARDVWPAEIKKWEHLQGLKMVLVLGDVRSRLAALEKPADIYVINRENVPWLVRKCGKRWPFDMVVVDELSSFKDRGAVRFRALKKVRPQIKRIIGLTGTPAPNGLIDLWPQIYLLDQGERLGPTISGYRNRYFTPGRSDPARHIVYEWRLKPGAEQHIYKKIADICISMRAEDWVEVPNLLEPPPVRVELPPEAWGRYKQLEREYLLPFADTYVTADTAAVLSNKLQQLANGAVYDENGKVQWVHDAKLDALSALIEEAAGRPLMVVYTYRHDLERLKQRFSYAETLDAPHAVQRWNEGRIPVLLIHPASAGHGLNLQYGGNIMIWFGLTWSLELYQQTIARLHRSGQREKVVLYHLVAAGTIDEDIMRRLAKKEAGQNDLLQAIKARIGSITAGD